MCKILLGGFRKAEVTRHVSTIYQVVTHLPHRQADTGRRALKFPPELTFQRLLQLGQLGPITFQKTFQAEKASNEIITIVYDCEKESGRLMWLFSGLVFCFNIELLTRKEAILYLYWLPLRNQGLAHQPGEKSAPCLECWLVQPFLLPSPQLPRKP